MDQIDDEARPFWGNIVKTKHQSLTSLAFMRLFPGAYQKDDGTDETRRKVG